ncbi:MAG: hypothetical protein AAFU64_20320, partial [Bacteroidota bacterium]
MQNKQGILIALSIVLVLVFVYFLFQNQNKVYNWQENYQGKNTDPYGALVITKLLEDQMQDAFVTIKKSLSNQLEDLEDQG